MKKISAIQQLLKTVVLVCFILLNINGFAQNDSIKTNQQDSALLSQQTKGNLLMAVADSVRLADSLQQEALLS